MRSNFYAFFLKFSVAAVIVFAESSYGAGVYTQWAHSNSVVINTSATGYNIASTLTNFPYLIRLNQSNFNFGQAKGRGADIRFTQSDSATVLSYQIELWDSANANAAIWVKVNSIAANNAAQSILMYWGNASAADSSNGPAVFAAANGFYGEYHLGDTSVGATGGIIDASGHNNGTAQGGMSVSNLVNGPIGKALSFSGSGQYISCGTTANIGMSSANHAYTLSAWINPAATRLDGTIVSYGTAATTHVISIDIDGNGDVFSVHYSQDYSFTNAPLSLNKWQHVALTYNPTADAESCFVNGAFAGSRKPAALTLAATSNLWIGGSTWNGIVIAQSILDEVTISNVQRSSDWIKLCYLNQKISATAAPTITYPGNKIKVLAYAEVSLTPVVTGLPDSITITPALPQYLLFNTASGAITGWTAVNNDTNQPFIIRAYNSFGATADTILFSFLGDTSATGIAFSGRAASAAPALLGVTRGTQVKIAFSVPEPQKLSEAGFTLFDCKGVAVWRQKVPGNTIQPGINSLIIKNTNLASGMYYLEMKTLDNAGNIHVAGKIRSIALP